LVHDSLYICLTGHQHPLRYCHLFSHAPERRFSSVRPRYNSLGAQYHSQCVRHDGDCGASLVDGSDNSLFDVHTDQSIYVLNICYCRIWCHLCRCHYYFACGLCIEKPCLLDRSRRRFSTGCMCSSFLLLCALTCFISADIDAALDRCANRTNWSRSFLGK